MTEQELEKEFRKEFEYDCYDLCCELRDCCECSSYQEEFEEFKKQAGMAE